MKKLSGADKFTNRFTKHFRKSLHKNSTDSFQELKRCVFNEASITITLKCDKDINIDRIILNKT